MTVDTAPPSRLAGARAWADWIARTVVAVLVTYVFIVVLLVATAQQKVDDALTKEAVGYDYSVAVRYYFGKESLKNVVGENSQAIKQSTDQLRAANDRVQSANRVLTDQAADLAEDLAAADRRRLPGAARARFAADPGRAGRRGRRHPALRGRARRDQPGHRRRRPRRPRGQRAVQKSSTTSPASSARPTTSRTGSTCSRPSATTSTSKSRRRPLRRHHRHPQGVRGQPLAARHAARLRPPGADRDHPRHRLRPVRGLAHHPHPVRLSRQSLQLHPHQDPITAGSCSAA